MVDSYSSQHQSPDLDPWTGKPRVKPSLWLWLKQQDFFSGKPSPDHEPPSTIEIIKISSVAISFIIFIWFLLGIFVVGANERALLLSWRQHEQMLGPGWHWRARFFSTVFITPQTALIEKKFAVPVFTKDKAIATFYAQIHYHIDNLREYCLQNNMPEVSLQTLFFSVAQQLTMEQSLDEWQTRSRSQWSLRVLPILKTRLRDYHTGLVVDDVLFQDIQIPEVVKQALGDPLAIEKEERAVRNKAYAEAKTLTLDADSKARVLMQKAEVDRTAIVNRTQLVLADYLPVLQRYQQAPEITREQLYFSMLHSVLPKEGKWILSNDAHNTDIHIAVDEKIKNIQGSEVIKNALSGVIHTPAASVVPLNTASDATVIDGQGMGRIYNEDPQEGASE